MRQCVLTWRIYENALSGPRQIRRRRNELPAIAGTTFARDFMSQSQLKHQYKTYFHDTLLNVITGYDGTSKDKMNVNALVLFYEAHNLTTTSLGTCTTTHCNLLYTWSARAGLKFLSMPRHNATQRRAQLVLTTSIRYGASNTRRFNTPHFVFHPEEIDSFLLVHAFLLCLPGGMHKYDSHQQQAQPLPQGTYIISSCFVTRLVCGNDRGQY
jgi:hypothetical protein